MRAWFFLLGGWLVWTAHFAGAYLIASLFDVAGDASAPGSRWAVGVLTLACLVANGVLLLMALRPPPFLRQHPDAELAGLLRSVGGLGAALSAAAVVWQGLPALVGN